MIVMLDGFEDGMFSYRWVASTNSSVVTTPSLVRNGTGSMNVNPTNTSNFAYYRIPDAMQHATVIVGFAFMIPAGTPRASNTAFCEIMSDESATSHLRVNITANGAVSILRGATTLATSGNGMTVQNGTWQYIEIKLVLNDTTGIAEVRVNEAVVVTFSGDTKNAGTKTVLDYIRWGILTSSANTYIDDVYVVNGDTTGGATGTYLGDIAVEFLTPNGDGSSSQFLGSDGNSTSNYQLVDDGNLADFVESNVSGDVDLYALSDMSRASGTVLGAQVTMLAQKTDSGARGIKPVVRRSGTTYEGAETTLSTAALITDTVWEQDPSTSAAWTVSGVNAMEAGAKVGT